MSGGALRSSWVKKALALSLGVSFALLLLLAAVAVKAYRQPFSTTDVLFEGDWVIESDAAIGFVPSKNASTTRVQPAAGLRYEIFTDTRGARVNAPGRQTPDRVDVLTVGGSFSWGHGLANEETFTELLGRSLDVPVANFSFGSYGTVPSLLLLERNLDLRPRVVVYGFINDHIRRNLSPCAPSLSPYCLPNAYVDFSESGEPFIHAPRMEFFSPEQNRKFYDEILLRQKFGINDVLWRLRVDLFRIAESRSITYPNDEASRWRSLEFLLGRMESAAARVDASLLFVYIPGLTEDSNAPPPPELVDIVRDRNLILFDLAPDVENHYRQTGGETLALPDRHPSALGHLLIASAIEREILERGLLTARVP